MPRKTRFTELKEVFNTLHSSRGCLWDRQQTHESLILHLKEEVREFIAAVQEGDDCKIREELGDILLLVMFNAQIARRSKRFDIEGVISTLIHKLKRRHPHVFGNVKVKSARQIIRNWNKIKSGEKK